MESSDLLRRIGDMFREFLRDILNPTQFIPLSVVTLLGFPVGLTLCGEEWWHYKKFWPFAVPVFGGGIVLLVWGACIAVSCSIPMPVGYEKDFAHGSGFLLAFALDLLHIKNHMKRIRKGNGQITEILKETEEEED